MPEIVCLEQNKKERNISTKKAIEAVASIGGYIGGSVIIGIYLDDKFFNHSGIVVIVSLLIGILFVILAIVRLVILTRDSK
jgi:F0F1-type ATP synthase assembly protein I